MTHRHFPKRSCRAGSASCCRFKSARTIIYVLITFSLVAELPSNDYGKSPLIISSKECLPESAGGRKKPHAHRPKGADKARSSLLSDSRVNLPFMRWMHWLQPASAPALKAIRSLVGPGQLSSFANVNGLETPALLTLF